MGLKSKLKHIVSFLLHGETRPVVAHITYLQADRQLEGKKIIITGGGKGIGYAMAKKFNIEGDEDGGQHQDTLEFYLKDLKTERENYFNKIETVIKETEQKINERRCRL